MAPGPRNWSCATCCTGYVHVWGSLHCFHLCSTCGLWRHSAFLLPVLHLRWVVCMRKGCRWVPVRNRFCLSVCLYMWINMCVFVCVGNYTAFACVCLWSMQKLVLCRTRALWMCLCVCVCVIPFVCVSMCEASTTTACTELYVRKRVFLLSLLCFFYVGEGGLDCCCRWCTCTLYECSGPCFTKCVCVWLWRQV